MFGISDLTRGIKPDTRGKGCVVRPVVSDGAILLGDGVRGACEGLPKVMSPGVGEGNIPSIFERGFLVGDYGIVKV